MPPKNKNAKTPKNTTQAAASVSSAANAASGNTHVSIDELMPRQIVAELDKYIIGQEEAKRAVAIAIRNRVRRRRVPDEIREEIYPKNIIMIGPTGCGKTEIARRLSRLSGAPFVKVEATKYTEIGYVGRDVESMVRELMSTAMNLVQKEFCEKVQAQAETHTRERLLDLLLPSSHSDNNESFDKNETNKLNIGDMLGMGMSQVAKQVQEGLSSARQENSKANSKKDAAQKKVSAEDKQKQERTQRARAHFAKLLDAGKLEDKEVDIETKTSAIPMVQVMTGGPNTEDMDVQIQNMLGDLLPKKSRRRHVSIKEARRILLEEETANLVDAEKVKEEALYRAEEMGIIFIDELDKICGKHVGGSGPEVSREGVQRDLLPIVEGATVNTRYGAVKTDHILFIAAGAFHSSSPSDLIPELQGRFPIRVELEKLSQSDFCSILVGPRNSLVRQAQELLATEDVVLTFEKSGIESMAAFAYEINEKTENIGARRLHTLMEHILDETSFMAPELPPAQRKVIIDKNFVEKRLRDIVKDKDLSRYIL